MQGVRYSWCYSLLRTLIVVDGGHSHAAGGCCVGSLGAAGGGAAGGGGGSGEELVDRLSGGRGWSCRGLGTDACLDCRGGAGGWGSIFILQEALGGEVLHIGGVQLDLRHDVHHTSKVRAVLMVVEV